MALFFILRLPEYTVLTFLLICRNSDFHSMRHFHPRIKERFKKQAFYTMEFLKYKKVINPCATTRGQGSPQGHAYPYSPTLPLFFLPLSQSLSGVLHSPPLQASHQGRGGTHLPSKRKNGLHFNLAFSLLSGL